MKNIKELGLELIELEDEVLLVDRTTPFEKTIASTKPVEGLPLLVIEDEVEILGNIFSNGFQLYLPLEYVKCLNEGFRAGYNKALETYKYTEDDLRKAFNSGERNGIYLQGGSNDPNDRMDFDELVKSLTEKELCIEVEVYVESGLTRHITKYNPKIERNVIKGIWK